jgi:hypothetical protein
MMVALIPSEGLMSEPDRTDRERVPVADIVAGDWILTHEEDRGDPVQFLWRSVQRVPNGDFRWSFKTSAGLRHFDHDEWIYRVKSTEQPVAGDLDAVDGDDSLEVVHALALEEARSAEASLIRAVFVGVAIAVPVSILLWVGLIALAVGGKDPEWGPWLGIAIGIGILNGVFFGALAGFVTKAHLLDDVDRHGTQVVESARTHRSAIKNGGDPGTQPSPPH